MLNVKQICELTGRKRSTVYSWLKQGLQPTSEAVVSEWAKQKDLAKVTEAGTPAHAKSGPLDDFHINALPDVGSEGAPQALARLQRFEKLMAQRLEAALLTDDELKIKRARENHVSVSAALMKYETLVAAHQREIGSLMSRREAHEIVKTVCSCIRRGVARFAGSSGSVEAIMACSDRSEASGLAVSGVTSGIASHLRDSLETNFPCPPDFTLLILQELHLPNVPYHDPANPDWAILHYSNEGGFIKNQNGKETIMPATQEEIERVCDHAVKTFIKETPE